MLQLNLLDLHPEAQNLGPRFEGLAQPGSPCALCHAVAVLQESEFSDHPFLGLQHCNNGAS